MSFRLFNHATFTAATALALLAFAPLTHATERRFTYTYEVTTAPKGVFELENWVTWQLSRGHKGESDRAHEFDFRHELEYGVTDRWEVSLYFADWHILDDADHNRSARYDDAALETIYRLTNPTTDFLGSALYGEIHYGDELLELEGKLLLQKDIGPLVAAYNVVMEGKWTGRRLDEREGEFSQTLGLSYELMPQLTVGAEVLHEIDIPDWSKAEKSVVWAGPNASFRSGSWFATVTPLFRLSENREEPDLQTRLIIGVHF